MIRAIPTTPRVPDRRPGPSLDRAARLAPTRSQGRLTAVEERTLAEAIARGDSDARERLICANLGLVITIARQFLGRGLPLEDLIGEGNLGLIRATRDFDPGFGARFSTYSAYWIKQSIRQALSDTASMIRLPTYMGKLLTNRRKVERRLHHELGTAPGVDRVDHVLGLSDRQKAMVRQAHRARRIHGESAAVHDDTAWSPTELVDKSDRPDVEIEAADEKQHLMARLGRLDERDRHVVELRFGLVGEGPMTLREVAKRLGVSWEWVRTAEARAIKVLARHGASEGG